tara:strand:+ start:437 stop:694 length:258 start_codon:yes stop_codon:yes gene_type:complete
MRDLINKDFVFIDECETIADYIQTHLYDTVHWQLPSPTAPTDPDHDEDMDRYNEIHGEAMEQVVAILATRFFNRPRRELKIINTK